MMGKMVTAATMISEGAVKSHPSRAILLRLTSARPTRGAAAGACSAALETVVIGHTPCPRSSRPAGLVGVRCGAPGAGRVPAPGAPAAGYRPPAALVRAVLAADWAAASAEAVLLEPASAAFTLV